MRWRTTIIVILLAPLGYVLRRNLRRSWHVLYTGNENPDWEKLGADYFGVEKREEK